MLQLSQSSRVQQDKSRVRIAMVYWEYKRELTSDRIQNKNYE
jgi:hypothetical protein